MKHNSAWLLAVATVAGTLSSCAKVTFTGPPGFYVIKEDSPSCPNNNSALHASKKYVVVSNVTDPAAQLDVHIKKLFWVDQLLVGSEKAGPFRVSAGTVPQDIACATATRNGRTANVEIEACSSSVGGSCTPEPLRLTHEKSMAACPTAIADQHSTALSALVDLLRAEGNYPIAASRVEGLFPVPPNKCPRGAIELKGEEARNIGVNSCEISESIEMQGRKAAVRIDVPAHLVATRQQTPSTLNFYFLQGSAPLLKVDDANFGASLSGRVDVLQFQRRSASLFLTTAKGDSSCVTVVWR